MMTGLISYWRRSMASGKFVFTYVLGVACFVVVATIISLLSFLIFAFYKQEFWQKPWPAEFHALDVKHGRTQWVWQLPTWDGYTMPGDLEFFADGKIREDKVKLCLPTPFANG